MKAAGTLTLGKAIVTPILTLTIIQVTIPGGNGAGWRLYLLAITGVAALSHPGSGGRGGSDRWMPTTRGLDKGRRGHMQRVEALQINKLHALSTSRLSYNPLPPFKRRLGGEAKYWVPLGSIVRRCKPLGATELYWVSSHGF